MEYTVLAVFVASISIVLVINEVQAYETDRPLYENLQNSVYESSNGQASSLFGPSKENTPQGLLDVSLEKQTAELEDIKDSLDTLAHGVGGRVSAHPSLLTLAEVEEALRQALSGKRLSATEMEEIFRGEMHRLPSRLNPFGKRGRNKFSVETRFAPFGTKLVPNRKLENGGATLLRYGRSIQSP